MRTAFTCARSIPLATWLLACVASSAQADVRLAGVFGDHMVLQRDVPLPVWGTADPGEPVAVDLAGAIATTTAAADGTWRVTLPPLAASAAATELRAAGRTTVTVQDVLVGDVWLASGQSNMQYALKGSHDGAATIARADRPTMRFTTVGSRAALDPQADRTLTWVASTPATAGKFSGVAWTFGEALQESTKVPIGLIGAYVSGTPAQSWTPRAALEASPDLRPYVDALAAAREKSGEVSGGTPTSLYNGMIAPLGRLPIKGVIWYQGESNVGEATYRVLFASLIRGWRAQWRRDDLPFLFVQLPGNGRRADEPMPNKWSLLREAQAAIDLPAAAMVVTLDLTPQRALLHPKNKSDIGRRLALAARHVAYREDVAWRSPSFESARFDGDCVHVRLRDVAGGLKLDVPPREDVVRGTTLPAAIRGFAVAGADRRFHWAEATIDADGNGVVVRSEAVPTPVAVRYGWGGNPEVNLYGGAGLPVAPFRSDDWIESFPAPATTRAAE